jgi:phosphoglycolate phosphatase-like HAD superfamily hydrolase
MAEIIVWDLDGTLVRSEDMEGVWLAACASHGLNLDAVREIWGRGHGRPLDEHLSELGVPAARAQQIVASFWDQYGPHRSHEIPGASETLRTLHEDGFCLVLSTGSRQLTADAVVDDFGWRRMFDLVLGSDTGFVKGPQHYARIAQLPGRPVAHIGDGTWDMMFGKQHGVAHRIGYTGTGQLAQVLRDHGATAIVADLADVPAVIRGGR